MAYLEIDTKQGPFIVDMDKISGVGKLRHIEPDENENNILAIFLIASSPVDLYLHSQEQADKIVEEIKKIIMQRKVRTPTKPILIGA